MKTFEIIEHTADIGIQAYGSTLEELFTHAAIGLFSLIIDTGSVRAEQFESISLQEENVEELLVAWLNELLFCLSARSFIPKEFRIKHISKTELDAEVRGELLDTAKHSITSEIKAATYHELSVRKAAPGYEARVIFDT